MTIKNILGLIRFRIYNLFFILISPSRSVIDYDLLDKKIEEHNLSNSFLKIEENIRKSLQEFEPTENKYYFSNMKVYDERNTLKKNPFPLFPPNVAVIDFILKNSKKDSLIVDYCCGFNNLSIILNNLGFSSAYGYDNFSQIKKERIESFLKSFNLISTLKSKEDVLCLPTNIILCICYYWKNIDKDIIYKEIENPNLKFIILDIRYTPPLFIKNFRIKTVYSGLIVVYERKI